MPEPRKDEKKDEFMTQKEMCEVFEKIQKYIESSEFKENATKVIKEYVNKNLADIESLVLGDKNSKKHFE